MATDPDSGSGHLARCRALAAAMPTPVLLFADPFGTADLDWPGEVVAEVSGSNAELAVAALEGRKIDGLLFDHYAISDVAIELATGSGFTAVFRDGGRYGPERISIDPNPGTTAAPGAISGPDYMPLATVFATRHDTEVYRDRNITDVRTVMIAFGARDSTNRTQVALDMLLQFQHRFRTTVVVGRHNPHREGIASSISVHDTAQMLNDPSDLADIYGHFDLAIGAPGISQFERACCGLPTILLAQNTRQEPLVKRWEQTGSAIASESSVEAVIKAIDRILADGASLKRIRQRCLALVDGRGAQRLATALNDALLQ